MSEFSSPELIALFRSGSRNEAGEGLYRRHHVWMRGWARERLWSDHSGVDDVVQETFRRFIRQLDDSKLVLPTDRSVIAWLRETLLRCVMERVRKYRPARGNPVEEAELCLKDPRDELQEKQQEEFLFGLLARLPALDREILELHCLEGVSTDSLAGRYGISVEAVRMRLSRARQRFGALLTEAEGTYH